MAGTKALKEQRFEIFKDLQAMREKANDPEYSWSPEDESAWDSANSDYDRLSRSIDMTERTVELEASLSEQKESREYARAEMPEAIREALPTELDKDNALQGWARMQFGMDLEEKHQVACRKLGVNPNKDFYEAEFHRGSYDVFRKEMRAQATSPASAGGSKRPCHRWRRSSRSVFRSWRPIFFVLCSTILRTSGVFPLRHRRLCCSGL